MANVLYPAGKEGFLTTAMDLNEDDMRAVLIDLADYTYSSAHDYYDDVPAAARVAVSGALGWLSVAPNFDTNDFSWTSVSGDPCEAVILFNYSGGADSARLLCAYYDTGMAGIPVTPNGANINFTVSASGWFSL